MHTFFVWAIIAALLITQGLAAQSGDNRQKSAPAKKPESAGPQSEREKPPPASKAEAGDQQDGDRIKLAATLVTVPVIASDRNGLYVPDLNQSELAIYEDGVQQQIDFFTTVDEPFHVALMLDTSASTQEKIGQIKRAAIAFVEQLHDADLVKIISFDDQVRDLVDFTSDRDALRQAIEAVRPGQGTKLYDAMQLALGALQMVERRKAIVIFTDGVDWRSERARYEDNIAKVEESGVIVYPIRYDTRAETEAIVRAQERNGRTVSLGDIFGIPGTGNTPTTIPGGERDPRTLPVPSPPISTPPIGVPRPRTDRDPRGDRFPDSRDPRSRRAPGDTFPDSRNDPDLPPPLGRPGDNVDLMLDGLYRTADEYLNELAARSGGKLHRADTLGSLPKAFGQIASEMRTQYAIGYYPKVGARDNRYRKIQVRTTRKGVVVRARPGYRAASENTAS
jgi:VWFA-related protein